MPAEQLILHVTWTVREHGKVSRQPGRGGLGVFSERGASGSHCHAEFRSATCPECTATMWLTILLSVFGSGLQLRVGGRFSRKIFDYAEEII